MLDAMHGLIRALQEQAQFDDAIAVAKRLLELDPDEASPTPASPSCITQGDDPRGGSRGLASQAAGLEEHLQQQKPKP